MTVTKVYSFTTPPPRGHGRVCFAYLGDTREGVGGSENAFMGVNRMTLERLVNLAWTKKANFLLAGGDLINGCTSVKEDYSNQFLFWKQTVSGLWHQCPIYTGMGDHELLLRAFDDSSHLAFLDRWPYTESSEALFEEAFYNPGNGPATKNALQPTYRESVYSFQYGPVKVICMNNTYWVSSRPEQFGGAPKGYIMDDQLQWVIQEVKKADQDMTVKYLILYAPELVFPNGGSVDDAMWYKGDNTVRAYVYDAHTKVKTPEKKGIIDMRNELVRTLAQCKKVAAVVGGDEHAYSRVLIDKNVPVGDPRSDDVDNDGVLDDGRYSPLSDLRYAVWYFSAGGAGAPYYSEEDTPWNTYWKTKVGHKAYHYSSQEHMLVFSADEQKISLVVYNPYGEMIDTIDDLMVIKK
jgi:hypothetical protein